MLGRAECAAPRVARHRRYGFQAECVERLGVQMGLQCWEQFNAVFDWLVRARRVPAAVLPHAAARARRKARLLSRARGTRVA